MSRNHVTGGLFVDPETAAPVDSATFLAALTERMLHENAAYVQANAPSRCSHPRGQYIPAWKAGWLLPRGRGRTAPLRSVTTVLRRCWCSAAGSSVLVIASIIVLALIVAAVGGGCRIHARR